MQGLANRRWTASLSAIALAGILVVFSGCSGGTGNGSGNGSGGGGGSDATCSEACGDIGSQCAQLGDEQQCSEACESQGWGACRRNCYASSTSCPEFQSCQSDCQGGSGNGSGGSGGGGSDCLPSGFSSDRSDNSKDITGCFGDHCPGGTCSEVNCWVNDVDISQCETCSRYSGITKSDLDVLCEKDGYFAVDVTPSGDRSDLEDHRDVIVECVDGEARTTECSGGVSTSYVEGICRADQDDDAMIRCN